MESNKLKTFGIVAAVILVILGMAFIIKRQHDSLSARDALIEKSTIQFKELENGIVRSQAKYSEDLEAWAKKNRIDLTPIQNDLKNLDAKVIGISTMLGSTPGYHGTNLPSSSTVPRPDAPGPVIVPCPSGGTVECPGDKFGFLSNVQTLVLSEPLPGGKPAPFGSVEFRAWEAKPWTLTVTPRTYSVTSVLGQDEEGRHYTYHQFAIKADGVSYPVKISESEFVEELPEAEFRFSPRLYLGVDFGAKVYPEPRAEVAPNLEVALFSYGQTTKNPDFTFLGLGASYQTQSETLGAVVTPVAYNVGNHLPLIDNLYVGPSIAADTGGGVLVLGGLKAGL